MPQDGKPTSPHGSALDVLKVFSALGVTSFGGPVAHLGYFREAFVVRRRWLDESSYADLVALGQFLPGPASSQVAFAIGLARAGLWGGLGAWCGFTLPSALLLLAFAYFATSLTGVAAAGAIHGLSLVAVAVVAQAVWGMARMLTPDVVRAAIAAVGAAIVLLVSGSFGQIAAILLGALAGLVLCRGLIAPIQGRIDFAISPRMGAGALALFFGLLLLLPLLTVRSHGLAVFEAFYRSGALVFGGGHVVLPLLHDAVVAPGWISPDAFLAGYGAAQAVPGPLFTVAAYLGASLTGAPNGVWGAGLALVAIFLPGMLILAGALPFWDRFRMRADAQAVMRGVNAAVVGLLAAALYDPLWKSAILSWSDLGLALAGFALLTLLKWRPLIVVVAMVAASMALALLG
ncbi:MAG TPA: chromate efflux transporter [Rhizomicrobium sp.]|nr:chromate efflux transporter [Rhizomicrobium sp.]